MTIPSVPEPLSLSYRQPVLATATGATFTSTSTGSSGGWFTTTRSGSSEQRRDFVEIFSNVEAPIREDIRDYSARTSVPRGVTTVLPWNLTFDVQGRPTNHLVINTANAMERLPRRHGSRARARNGKENWKHSPLLTEDQTKSRRLLLSPTFEIAVRDDGNPATNYDTSLPDYRLAVRNEDRYPERYSIDISGSLHGRSGNVPLRRSHGGRNLHRRYLRTQQLRVRERYRNGMAVHSHERNIKGQHPRRRVHVVRMVEERANRDHFRMLTLQCSTTQQTMAGRTR